MKISSKQILIAIEPNKINILTIILIENVKVKGIPCIISLKKEKLDECNVKVTNRNFKKSSKKEADNTKKNRNKKISAKIYVEKEWLTFWYIYFMKFWLALANDKWI